MQIMPLTRSLTRGARVVRGKEGGPSWYPAVARDPTKFVHWASTV